MAGFQCRRFSGRVGPALLFSLCTNNSTRHGGGGRAMFPATNITDQEYANQKITEIQAIMRGPGITPENLRFFLLAAIERGREQERERCKNIVESKWDQWYHNRRSCG